jgi:hypothetical protein
MPDDKIFSAPKFVHLSGSSASEEERSIRLVFGTEDKRRFGIELAASVVPLVMIELGSALPAVVANDTPPMEIVEVTPEQDGITLVLRLANGLQVPAKLSRLASETLINLTKDGRLK